MAYTPELSIELSQTLRRIAWALGKPMTRTSEDIMELLAEILNRESICRSCRDNSKCSSCRFHSEHHNEKTKIHTLLKS